MAAGGTVAILGGGKIGEALLSGLVRGGERTIADVVVSEKHAERAIYLEQKYGVKTLDVAGAAAVANTLVIAVKPQDIDALLAELSQVVTSKHLVVSVAAGVPTARIERSLPDGVPVVRCMPNTPALVDEAMIDAGILLGLPRALAADLIVQTAVGSAIMLRDSGEHPVQLCEAVTSPGGTTIAAIRELEVHGVRAALLAAIEAAAIRSAELGASD